MIKDWLIVLALVFPVPTPNAAWFRDGVSDLLERYEMGPYRWHVNESDSDWGHANFVFYARERFYTLHDAPQSIEADRLPTVRFLSEQIELNFKFREKCQFEINHFPAQADRWREMQSQAEWIGNVYNAAVQAARAGDHYNRRVWLKELITLCPAWGLAYWLPPPMPTWLLAEVGR